MTTSKTQISNFALAHCGIGAAIQDFDNEASAEAEACRLFLDHCRGLMLESQPWSFAQRRVALADLGSPPDQWVFRYKYPNFCARVNKVINPITRSPNRDQVIPFLVENGGDTDYGKVILTDQCNAQILYNHDITDLNLFSITARQALSLLLATHIAPQLRVKADLAKLTQDYFSIWSSEAGSLTLGEPQPDQERESQFVNARN